jgi:hypothetical protein
MAGSKVPQDLNNWDMERIVVKQKKLRKMAKNAEKKAAKKAKKTKTKVDRSDIKLI